MGLAASQARLLMLTDRACNLEFQGENIAEKRMEIANQTSQLIDQEEAQGNSGVSGGDILNSLGSIVSSVFGGSSSSGSNNAIQDQLAKLQEEDKMLEMKLNQIDTQHKAVTTEMDSVKKVIDKNIESTFKILG